MNIQPKRGRPFGTQVSEETRKKISENHKNNPTIQASIKKAMLASKRSRAENGISESGKHSLSLAQKNSKLTLEHCRNMANKNKGKPRSPDTIEKIRNSLRTSPRAQKQREDIRKNKRETEIERRTREFLMSIGIDFIPQYQIGSFCVDFYVPSLNVAIECDGRYWHSLPKSIERDSRKNLFMQSEGIRLVRIPEGTGRSKSSNILPILGKELFNAL